MRRLRAWTAAALSRVGLQDLGFVSRWLLLASAVGVAAGLAAVALEWMIHFVQVHALERAAPVEGEGVWLDGWRSALALVLPAAGAFVAVWLGLLLSPESQGHGTEQVIAAFHLRGGRMQKRVAAVKALTSAITIGSGGSGGQEGPVTQIGASVGGTVADAFRLPPKDRRIFFLAGASAGIGALFCAPLGGALFAPEVLYKKPEFEGEAIVPCIIASIVAFTTRTTLTGQTRLVPLSAEIRDALAFDDPRHLPVYVALALFCALFSLLYTRTFRGVHALFGRATALSAPQRAALGGFLLGALALAIAPFAQGQGIFYGGYALMRASISGDLALSTLVLLVLAKILATSLTIGSGGSGGMFAPSMAIGALLGAAVGTAAARGFPGLALEPACVAFVGMGAFFAGVAKTPIAAIIIVSEMTGSYGLLAPLMLASVLHLLLAQRWSLYDTQVPGLVDSPEHAGEFVVDVLEGLKVKDVVERFTEATLVPETTTLRKALEIVSASRSTYFPVVDREQRLVGIFGLTDVRRIFHAVEVADVVIVRDFMVEEVVTVTPDDEVNHAVRLLDERMIAQLPVVDPQDPRKVLGMLSRNHLGAAYHQKLAQLRRAGRA